MQQISILIEEHVGLSILDAGLGDLSHSVVIKLIPQVVLIVPAVGYVVATWN